MIKLLCGVFLNGAASRWPAETREEMLAEWRAEMHAAPGTSRRLRYAVSLAVARPHGEQAISGATIAWSLLGSLVVTVGLPVIYLWKAVDWTGAYSEDTIPWQVWVAVASVVAAVPLAIICARVTSGVTQLIRPAAVGVWTFLPPMIAWFATYFALHGVPVHSDVIDISLWALTATVLCGVAASVARRHAAFSWGVLAVGVLAAYWFRNMHNEISHFDLTGMEFFFGGSWPAGYSFLVGSSPNFHVTIFLLVYAHSLATKAVVTRRPIAMPAHR
jgi:hypothetical protein